MIDKHVKSIDNGSKLELKYGEHNLDVFFFENPDIDGGIDYCINMVDILNLFGFSEYTVTADKLIQFSDKHINWHLPGTKRIESDITRTFPAFNLRSVEIEQVYWASNLDDKLEFWAWFTSAIDEHKAKK